VETKLRLDVSAVDEWVQRDWQRDEKKRAGTKGWESQTSLKNERWQQKCNNWTTSGFIICFETLNDINENMKPPCEWNIQLSKYMWQCFIHYRLTGVKFDTFIIWVCLQAYTTFQNLALFPSSCDWLPLYWHTKCWKIFLRLRSSMDLADWLSIVTVLWRWLA
jgi:hypothetical protein